MEGFLDYIEKQNSHIENIIVQLERDDPALTVLDFSREEIRGDVIQGRFLKALKYNTHLTSLDVSGTVFKVSYKQLVDFFTRNLSLTSVIFHKRESAEAVKLINYVVQLNISMKQTLALAGMSSEVMISARTRRVATLPMFIFTSPNSVLITNIDVSYNRLSEIPKEITKLTSLSVSLTHNRITKLLPEIGILTNLTSLNVGNNRLVALPSSIGLLAKLKLLQINNNSLRQLPITLGNCSKLMQIHLNQNSFVSIPQEIISSLHHDPAQADILLGYLHNLQKGSKRFYNMKLMFVGNGNVGKTMLMRALTEQAPSTWMQRMTGTGPPSPGGGNIISSFRFVNLFLIWKDISTDGIDISDWVVNPALTQDFLPLVDDRLIFSCWDFAGQEVYYTTHQFFLSQRSLYLVIFDMRYPEEEISRIEYWMQSIMSRTSNSPIVIVGTHSGNPVCTRQYVDKVMDEVERRINKVKCADLVKTYASVDSVQGGGVDSLRAKLVSLALEQSYMGEEIPQNYTSLQLKINAIKQTKKASLMWEEYSAIAVECGIRPSDVVAVTKYLHNLGVIVHFADEQLKNLVVVDPQFLVDIMATIFTTKNSFVKGGILNHCDLPHIWREPRFPAALHTFMLNLLQRFEVCFSFPGHTDETGSSLFPSLLPKERPSIDIVWPADLNWLLGTGHVQHDRLFQLDFFPSGLFSRLLVRLLQTARSTKIWRYGVILSLDSEMAIIELTQHNILRISVRGGPNTSTFFRMLVDIFELLVSKWYNIKSFKRSIPCTHCLSNPTLSHDPHFFALEDCERSASLGTSSIHCPKANGSVRLDLLVPDVVLSDLESRKIDFGLVKIEKQLAKGGYGIVYKGEYNDQVVAVKQLIIDEDATDMERNAKAFAVFRREVWVMSGLRHPNIVQLLGFCVNPMSMVMEYVPAGTLYKFLAIDRSQPLEWSMRLKCASDIAHGMLFLHTLNPPLMHRDFKSPNVMMCSHEPTSSVVCKVGDFGLSSQMWVESLKERDIANPTWLAPEVISETEYTVKSDVYSFGLILWELITRQHPYQEYDCKFSSQLEQLIVSGKRPTIPLECIPEYEQLILSCWHPDPKARPDFQSIVEMLDIMLDQTTTVSNYGIRKKAVPPLVPPPSSPRGNATNKTADATFAKILRASRPVWCLCSHNNRVWSAHGVESSGTPTILSHNPPSFDAVATSPSSSKELPSPLSTSPRLSSPSTTHPSTPPLSPRTSDRMAYPPSSPPLSQRNASPSHSPRPTPPLTIRTSASAIPFSSSPSTSLSPSPSHSPSHSLSTSPTPPRRQLGKNSVVQLPNLETEEKSQKKIFNAQSEICIWDSESGDLVGKVTEAHVGLVTSFLVVNDDVWSGAEDGSIKCWNIQSWQNIHLKEEDSFSIDEFSGFLMKKSLNRFQQIWQKRWFVLKGNTLTRYKLQTSTRPKEVIELKAAESISHKRRFCISLTVKSTSKGKPEGTTVLIAAVNQEEHDAWLAKLQANTLDLSALPPSFLKPDLVGETFCGFGAVKCMQIIDNRVWAGSRGCICAWNIEEQRYTGVIKLNKTSSNMKGEDLEETYVTQMIPHGPFVWCAAGTSIIRVDPKTRQLLECFEGHTAPIDAMILMGSSLWTCSAADHTLRFWDANATPGQALKKLGTVFEGNDGVSLSKVDNLLWFGGSDGSIRIWDPETKSIQKTLEKKHTSAITHVVVGLANKTVWVASADSTISVWLLS